MRLLVNFAFCFCLSGLVSLAHADRIKDLASLAGVRNNQLVGYGLVVGLSGTGDANLPSPLVPDSIGHKIAQNLSSKACRPCVNSDALHVNVAPQLNS